MLSFSSDHYRSSQTTPRSIYTPLELVDERRNAKTKKYKSVNNEIEAINSGSPTAAAGWLSAHLPFTLMTTHQKTNAH